MTLKARQSPSGSTPARRADAAGRSEARGSARRPRARVPAYRNTRLHAVGRHEIEAARTREVCDGREGSGAMRIGDRHVHRPPQHEREAHEPERDDGPGIRDAGRARLAHRRPGRQRQAASPASAPAVSVITSKNDGGLPSKPCRNSISAPSATLIVSAFRYSGQSARRPCALTRACRTAARPRASPRSRRSARATRRAALAPTRCRMGCG